MTKRVLRKGESPILADDLLEIPWSWDYRMTKRMYEKAEDGPGWSEPSVPESVVTAIEA